MTGSPSIPLAGDKPVRSTAKVTPVAAGAERDGKNSQPPFPDPTRLTATTLPAGEEIPTPKTGSAATAFGASVGKSGGEGAASVLFRLGAAALQPKGSGADSIDRTGGSATPDARTVAERPGRHGNGPSPEQSAVRNTDESGSRRSTVDALSKQLSFQAPQNADGKDTAAKRLAAFVESDAPRTPAMPQNQSLEIGPRLPDWFPERDSRALKDVARVLREAIENGETITRETLPQKVGLTGGGAEDGALSDAARALAAYLPSAAEARGADAGAVDPRATLSKAKKQPAQWLKQPTYAQKGVAVNHAAINSHEPKPTILRVETHLPPVRPLEITSARGALPTAEIAPQTQAPATPSAEPRATFQAIAPQIREAISTALSDPALGANNGRQPGEVSKLRPLVRVVEISLQPASLGAVAITLRLTGAGLRINVAAETQETADALREDAEALEALVRTAGYDPESVTVTHRPS